MATPRGTDTGMKGSDRMAEGQLRVQHQRFGRINKTLLAFKLYYFFTFGGRACIRPFLPVYFRHLGMSAEQTGMLLALRPIAELIGTPFSGGLADKYRKHKLVMMMMCVSSAALFFSLVFVRPMATEGPDSCLERTLCMNGSESNTSKETNLTANTNAYNCSLMDITVVPNCRNHSVLGQPTRNKRVGVTGKTKDNNTTFLVIGVIFFLSSLLGCYNSFGDAATVKYLTAIDRGGDYGKQRLWGAVGWGSFAVISGFGIDESGKHLSQNHFLLGFCAYLIFNIGTALTILKLPMEYLEGRSTPKIFRNLWTILSDCRILTFLLAILVMGTCMGVIDAYLFWFLDDLNGSHLLMGLALATTCIAEAPVMFFSGHLIKYLGHHGVLYLTLICYTIRYICYSFIPSAWYVLAIEPLHGVTFGAMWAATTSYGGLISPDGLAATVMALVVATHFSLGRLIAGFGGGIIYGEYGPRILFRGLAVTSVVTCVFFALSQKWLKKRPRGKYSFFQSEILKENSDVMDFEMAEVNLDSGDEI